MRQQVFEYTAETAAENQADDLQRARTANMYVVRSPEIVWVPEGALEMSERDARAIARSLAEIEAALSDFELERAEDICWGVWSLCTAAGATELSDKVHDLAIALDSNNQLSSRYGADQQRLLEAARASLSAAVQPARDGKEPILAA